MSRFAWPCFLFIKNKSFLKNCPTVYLLAWFISSWMYTLLVCFPNRTLYKIKMCTQNIPFFSRARIANSSQSFVLVFEYVISLKYVISLNRAMLFYWELMFCQAYNICSVCFNFNEKNLDSISTRQSESLVSDVTTNPLGWLRCTTSAYHKQ